MQNKALKSLKQLDLFGHRLNLSFHRQDAVHNTLAGGFLSFLVITIMMIITYDKTKQMLFHENDNIVEYDD